MEHRTIEPGVYQIDNEAYHRGPGISKSGLDLINQSPDHYAEAYLRGRRREPTPAMILGDMVHKAILEPDLFKAKYAKLPNPTDIPGCLVTVDDLKKKATELGIEKGLSGSKGSIINLLVEKEPTLVDFIWEKIEDKHRKANEGKTIIKAEDFDTCMEMVKKVHAHPRCQEGLLQGVPEQSMYWIDRETGVLCKARPDFLRTNGVIIDVKTTQDASLKEFEKSIANFRYHVQAAFYIDGLATLFDLNPDDVAFVFIAVEKTAPYGISVFRCNHAMVEKGRQLYRRDLELYAKCLRDNHWPSYTHEIQEIGLPAWAWAD